MSDSPWKPGDRVLVRCPGAARDVPRTHVATLVKRFEGSAWVAWEITPHWPGMGPNAVGCDELWIICHATPENLAQYQLSQLGAEDAL